MSLLFIQDRKKKSDNKIKVFHLLIKSAFGVLHVYGTKAKPKHHT